jgi:hypothetical protein
MTTLRALTLGFGLFLLPLAAAAQSPSPAPATDPRWVPWLGCWQLLTESVRDGQIDPVEMFERAAGLPARRVDGAQVCMLPGERPEAIAQSTWVNNQRIIEETLRADGQSHAVTEAKCKGSRKSEWSSTGRMLYTTADLTCEGQAPRKISSLAMMSGRTWIDIQAVEISGRTNIRVKKYQLAADQSLAGNLPRRPRNPEAERAAAAASFTFDDVKDASGKVAPEVIQAAIYEGTAKFPLNKKRLLELDDAGVDSSVIDLMVALSFPEKFVVDRSSSSSGGGGGGGWGGGWGIGDMWDPFYTYSLLSLYAPYSYGYWGSYNPGYQPGCCWTSIPPSGGGSVVPDIDARAVNGRGYTRIQPREVEPTRINRGDSGSGTASTYGGGGSNTAGSSGGSSGVSSGGYSSGGSSGGDSGRTAVPRPPGL